MKNDDCSQGRKDGEEGGTIPRAPDHYGGAEKSQQFHNYLLHSDIFASGRPQVRTWERQTSFLSRAPSNLVSPLTDCSAEPSPEILQ